VRVAVALFLALVLTGCESNVERSARLAKLTHRPSRIQTGLVIERENPSVKVLATTVLHDANGMAAVVTLRNDSPTALRNVPIAITLHGPRGQTLYRNNSPGLSGALVSVPLLLADQQFDWIDDQIQASGAPGALGVRVGEAATVSGALPRLSVRGVHLAEESGSGPSAEGTVVNRSAVAQQELVVFAVARRGSAIVAAGRAVLPNVAAHASTPFQLFFIGNPTGAALEVSAPPTTLR
jgi:hypothetical protein